jgi:hypothetical protein
MFEEARRVMAAQEGGWDTKTADELEMIAKLTETCKKLKAEKGALEVRYILFHVYLISFLFWGSASCCAYFIKVIVRIAPRNNYLRCLFIFISSLQQIHCSEVTSRK